MVLSYQIGQGYWGDGGVCPQRGGFDLPKNPVCYRLYSTHSNRICPTSSPGKAGNSVSMSLRAYAVARLLAALAGALASSAFVGWRAPPSSKRGAGLSTLEGPRVSTLEGPHGLDVLGWTACLTCVLSVLTTWVLVGRNVGLIRYALRCSGGMLVGTLFFHVIVVLFGAPVHTMFYRSLFWSATQAAYVFLPCAGAHGLSWQAWRRIYVSCEWHSNVEKLCGWTGAGCCAGAWLGACLIPLDWDEPWQQWPLPLLYGSMVGFVLVHVAAALFMEPGPVR